VDVVVPVRRLLFPREEIRRRVRLHSVVHRSPVSPAGPLAGSTSISSYPPRPGRVLGAVTSTRQRCDRIVIKGVLERDRARASGRGESPTDGGKREGRG